MVVSIYLSKWSLFFEVGVDVWVGLDRCEIPSQILGDILSAQVNSIVQHVQKLVESDEPMMWKVGFPARKQCFLCK